MRVGFTHLSGFAGIEHSLDLSASTVEEHVNSIFGKLRLADAPVHRRVAAVLAFLRDAWPAWPPGRSPVVGRGKWLTLIELFGSHRAARTVA